MSKSKSKSKSQKENVRAKSVSPTSCNKPIPGKRILNVKTDQVNVKRISKKFFNAPVSAWTSPSKLVNSIQSNNMSETEPKRALEHTRTSLNNIGKSNSVPERLSRYAANRHNYSLKSKFSDEFVKLYAAKRRRVQDCALREKSRALSSKAIDSAYEITDKALGIVKDSKVFGKSVSGIQYVLKIIFMVVSIAKAMITTFDYTSIHLNFTF